MNRAIEIAHLYKKFDNHVLFSDFSTEIQTGQTTCIMGKSGCGKTTLLHILMGLIKPESGMITGIDHKSISVIFQENRLCEHLSALRNVLLPVKETLENNERALHLLAVCGLNKSVAEQKTAELSGGMKRRVAIVRALLVPADVFLMDEPVKELDAANRDRVVDTILNETQGKTVLIATHDPKDIDRFRAENVIKL